MSKRVHSFDDDWVSSTKRLFEGPLMPDVPLDLAMPNDGRDLPDVDLDRLAEASLRQLTRTVAGPNKTPRTTEEPR